MSETTPICRIHKKYSRIKCQDTALPGDPDGLCILHCQDKGKDPVAFKSALQARWNQADQEFHDFCGVFFPGPFEPGDVFGSREFKKPIYFARASFTGGVSFIGASFKEADFYRASFTGEAHFIRASFKEASFTEASFTGESYFTEASFKGEAGFFGATIAGRVFFREMNPAGKEGQVLPLNANFSGLQFQENGVLRFQDMSLAQVKFAGTDLRRPEFHHVTWHPHRGRQALYDEIELRRAEKKNPWFWNWLWAWVSYQLPLVAFSLEIGLNRDTAPYLAEARQKPQIPLEDEYGEMERLYRNLQVNYESVNDYKSSGDFHYGEMEMHRRASPWRYLPLYWYNLYWLSSGYGERPLRAVLTLVGLLLALSGVLFLLGGVEEKLADHWNKAGFWQALLYVFQQGTLQKPDWLKPATAGGRFLSALMPVLIPGQTALFFLALRNRLGRRR